MQDTYGSASLKAPSSPISLLCVVDPIRNECFFCSSRFALDSASLKAPSSPISLLCVVDPIRKYMNVFL